MDDKRCMPRVGQHDRWQADPVGVMRVNPYRPDRRGGTGRPDQQGQGG
jgi:hypothetical protein